MKKWKKLNKCTKWKKVSTNTQKTPKILDKKVNHLLYEKCLKIIMLEGLKNTSLLKDPVKLNSILHILKYLISKKKSKKDFKNL